jgi:2-C-methyl-D-erythritol 2,4-cyclodiphosphate synthase
MARPAYSGPKRALRRSRFQGIILAIAIVPKGKPGQTNRTIENRMGLPIRVGLGFDSHRIQPGGPMKLGGITIDCGAHLVGHSDADVLLHAITDALLGAAGMDDIGQVFPNTDAANRYRDSAEMLRVAWQLVQQRGYGIVNLDCVVQTEVPKIGPHKQAMRIRIAEILGLDMACVGLKGKTGEGVGDVGAGRLAQAQCVVLLTYKEQS